MSDWTVIVEDELLNFLVIKMKTMSQDEPMSNVLDEFNVVT